MKAILICPSARPELAALATRRPLAAIPILGQSLVELWIHHLVSSGAKEILVLATDRPDQIRELTGDGARWGIRVDVIPSIRELTPAEARFKYRQHDTEPWLPEPLDSVLADRLPQLPDRSMLDSHASWTQAAQRWLGIVPPASRIGVRETAPGISTGLGARVHPAAILRPPCWIGNEAAIGPDAEVGPNAIIEDGAVISRGCEVSSSIVGENTLIGDFVQLKDAIAWGGLLIQNQTGSATHVPDTFLQCSLDPEPSALKAGHLFGWIMAGALMILTAPLAFLAMARAKIRGKAAFRPLVAVRPQIPRETAQRTLVYYELTEPKGWLRRWPQLWHVLRGEFAWVGNRPLSPGEAATLANEFERLWLAAPIGLISHADASGCFEFTDAARAHSSYYAAHANWRLDLAILTRFCARPLLKH